MASQRGSVLVFVTLTVALLMFFGLTFATMTTAQFRSAINHTDSVQAFNSAEAGLNWAWTRMEYGNEFLALDTPEENLPVPMYRSSFFGGSDTHLNTLGDLEVTIDRISPTTWEIVAQARRNNARRTVVRRVIVNHPTSLSDLDFRVHHYNVTPKIAQGTVDPVPPRTIIPHNFPPPISPPAPLGLPPALFSGGLVSGDYGATMTIDMALTVNIPDANDVVVVVDNLTINAPIVVNRSGSGRLIFHVEDKLILGSLGRVNLPVPDVALGERNAVVIYYSGSKDLSFAADFEMRGVVVSARRSGTIGTAQVHVAQGVNVSMLMTDNDDKKGGVLINGNSTSIYIGLLYAPRTFTRITGTSDLFGTLVTNDLHVAGEGVDLKVQLLTHGWLEELWGIFAGTAGLWRPGSIALGHWGSR